MKRIIIIGEGQTEQSFCNDLLKFHFIKHKILIENPTIRKTHGGIVNWKALKYQIENHLKQDTTAIVTTLIDYYGMYEHHEYPEWAATQNLIDKTERLAKIENSMLNEIDAGLRRRFIPYIQLHEFESLLFSKESAIVDLIPDELLIGKAELEELMVQYPNPEMINNAPETSPSHRLKKIIKGYSKVLHGELICEGIGLDQLRLKCPHFNEWVSCMERIQIVI